MQHTKKPKLLILCDDITVTGGVERVVSNLANALTTSNEATTPNATANGLATNIGGGGNTIHIVSIYRTNKILPYNLDSSIKIRFLHNYSQKHKPNALAKIFSKIKILSCKLGILILTAKLHKTREIHRIMLNLYINKIAKQNHIDIIIENTWESLHPYFKAKGIAYAKVLHSNIANCGITKDGNPRYDGNPKDFDLLILLSSRELPIWQTYHHNIAVIPNFLPEIPTTNANLSQRFVLSVGRMDKGDQKGFLRLLDIWKIVQEMINNPSLKESETNEAKQGKAEVSLAIHKKEFCHTEQSEVSQPQTQKRDISGFALNMTKIDSVAFSKSQYNKADLDALKEWKLVIVGDGIMKSQIESKINDLGLQDSIILKPFTKEIEKEYLSASVYAMSSHWEGFPMVLLEACSYGLPCIAFDIATGPSDIIKHSKSGFLISDDDLEAYANHLLKLMSDESMRINFGIEAKRIVGERFSKEVIMEKWEEVFRELLKFLD